MAEGTSRDKPQALILLSPGSHTYVDVKTIRVVAVLVLVTHDVDADVVWVTVRVIVLYESP